tara:strand:+ start:309 stop:815 length:507 start_codon:yes stop_codon:yes gene_type:complete
MRVFISALILLILFFIALLSRKSYNVVVENFSDTGEALAGMGGVMADPTMTFASNKMKGGDDKLVNDGKIINGYKASTYVFKADEVSKSFPLAVVGESVDNEAMTVVMWQAATKIYEQVSMQQVIINELQSKLALIEERLKMIEPALANVKEPDLDAPPLPPTTASGN